MSREISEVHVQYIWNGDLEEFRSETVGKWSYELFSLANALPHILSRSIHIFTVFCCLQTELSSIKVLFTGKCAFLCDFAFYSVARRTTVA